MMPLTFNKLKDNKEELRSLRKIQAFYTKDIFGLNDYSMEDEFNETFMIYDEDKFNHYTSNLDFYGYVLTALRNKDLSMEDMHIKKLYRIKENNEKSVTIEDEIKKGITEEEKRIINIFTVVNSTYKCETENGNSFYITDEFGLDIKRLMPISDAFIKVMEEYNNDDGSMKNCYLSTMVLLKKLKDLGINEVYYNDYGFIYEKSGKVFVNRFISGDELENGKDNSDLDTRLCELEEISAPKIKMSSKRK
jgi:hypothetical protein